MPSLCTHPAFRLCSRSNCIHQKTRATVRARAFENFWLAVPSFNLNGSTGCNAFANILLPAMLNAICWTFLRLPLTPRLHAVGASFQLVALLHASFIDGDSILASEARRIFLIFAVTNLWFCAACNAPEDTTSGLVTADLLRGCPRGDSSRGFRHILAVWE